VYVARLGLRDRQRVEIEVFETEAELASLQPLEDDLPGGPQDEPDYIRRNRTAWELWAPGLAARGRDDWKRELCWGLWSTPEAALRLLDGIAPYIDVVELGAGAGAISAALARRDLRPVAVDFSRHQIEIAHRLQSEFDQPFPLVHANVEQVPFDLESFDLAISEYGASLWCDPRRWLPEAHRLLRPNGRLIFIANSAMLMACTPPDGGVAHEQLVRPSFGGRRVEFAQDGTVEFHLSHGSWIRMLRAAGFDVEDLLEVRPQSKATPRYEFASLEWARKWPSEEIWIVRKRG
jgi:SAM-dependent methyltransferase